VAPLRWAWAHGRFSHVWPLPADVNHAQAEAMLPTIEKFLDSRAGGYTGGLLAVNYPKLKSRNFWIATIIEITRAGPPPAHVGIGGSQLESACWAGRPQIGALISLMSAEGVGFEPTRKLTPPSGFQDLSCNLPDLHRCASQRQSGRVFGTTWRASDHWA